VLDPLWVVPTGTIKEIYVIQNVTQLLIIKRAFASLMVDEGQLQETGILLPRENLKNVCILSHFSIKTFKV
jgi:hypothetical protein